MENKALFREKRDSDAEPLSTDVEFNYVDADTKEGHVIVMRRMQIRELPEQSIISIRLVRADDRWPVIHETAFVRPIEP